MNDQKAIILGRLSIFLLGLLWLVKSVLVVGSFVFRTGEATNFYYETIRVFASSTTITWILLLVAGIMPYLVIWNNERFQTSFVYIIFACLLFSSISARQLTLLLQYFGFINTLTVKWYNILLELLPAEILVLSLIQPVKIPEQKIKHAEIIIALGLVVAQIITILAAPQLQQPSTTPSLGLSLLVELQMSLLYLPLIYLNFKVVEHLKHPRKDTNHKTKPPSRDSYGERSQGLQST